MILLIKSAKILVKMLKSSSKLDLLKTDVIFNMLGMWVTKKISVSPAVNQIRQY